MGFLETIVTALTAGSTGGLLGILGGVASSWMKTRAAAVEMEREKLRFEQRLQMMKFQAEKAAGERDLTALAEGIKAESKTNEHVSPWVSDFKSLWRPALTAILLALTTAIFFSVLTGTLVLETGTPKADIINTISHGIVFLTNLSVSFWFASRGAQQDRISK